jgi:hypothetical protein
MESITLVTISMSNSTTFVKMKEFTNTSNTTTASKLKSIQLLMKLITKALPSFWTLAISHTQSLQDLDKQAILNATLIAWLLCTCHTLSSTAMQWKRLLELAAIYTMI